MVIYKGENNKRLIWCVPGSSFRVSACTLMEVKNFIESLFFKFEFCIFILRNSKKKIMKQ